MATRDNISAITFPTPTAAWLAPTHYSLWTSMTGGTFLGATPLTGTPAAPAIGATVSFAAGALDITVPDGELSSVGGGRAAAGITSSTVYVSLHSSDPGDDGSNELSGGGYARVAVATGGWS